MIEVPGIFQEHKGGSVDVAVKMVWVFGVMVFTAQTTAPMVVIFSTFNFQLYSYRNATIGSTRVARRAGITQATIAVVMSSNDTPMRVTGS